jgi:integrase
MTPLYSTTVSRTLRQPLRRSFSEPEQRPLPKNLPDKRLRDACLCPRNRARIFRGCVQVRGSVTNFSRPTPTAIFRAGTRRLSSKAFGVVVPRRPRRRRRGSAGCSGLAPNPLCLFVSCEASAVQVALLSRGTRPTYVQKLLGHASVQLTLDRYSHWMPSMEKRTASAVEEALG